MNLIFLSFLIFFAIIGFSDVIKYILINFFSFSKRKIKNPNEAEFIIRNVVNQNLWNNRCSKLIRIDKFDNETEKIINIAQNDFDFLDFKFKKE